MKSILSRIRGFTLIETLVAVSLLVVAIVAPMSLVSQSLTSAFYARDQIAAYNLAQEAIEAVRAVRDGNILDNALNNAHNDLLADILPPELDERIFYIDATEQGALGIETCTGPVQSPCPYLQVEPNLEGDGELYGYGSNWTNTRFKRSVHVAYVGPPEINDGKDEIRVTVTVLWDTTTGRTREFKMSSNMYRWVDDGVAQ